MLEENEKKQYLKKLKDYQKNKNFDYKQMANVLGVSETYVRLILQGHKQISKQFVTRMSMAKIQ